MSQRGRKTALKRPLTDGRPRRLQPPRELPEPERRIWARVVGNATRGHFEPSDTPLITAYVGAIAQLEWADLALREQGDVLDGKLNPWGRVKEMAIKSIEMLSMRLRVSPQARRDKAKVPDRSMSYYEQMELEENDPNGGWPNGRLD